VRKLLEAGFLLAALAVAAMQTPAQSLSASHKDALVQANAALQAGEADRALALLNSLPDSAGARILKCRVYFMIEHYDEAATECEQAVNLDGQNSDNHLWFGRALGEKAENASFIYAFSLAKRARTEFEQAVSLNPQNVEALADLGEFYTSAPSVVGGGNDKAEGLLPMLDKVDPEGAHQLRGRIAESRKDYGTAEREYQLAIGASQHPSFAWMSLGSFYRKRERFDEMEAAVQSGYKAALRDKTAGVALYNGATVLIRGKRNLSLAADMLERYLVGYTKSEEAPAFVAHTSLAHLKSQLGDSSGAWQERTAALQLAHDYKPAVTLKF
jgi:tetratricopeptide (TPR) repeat protein